MCSVAEISCTGSPSSNKDVRVHAFMNQTYTIFLVQRFRSVVGSGLQSHRRRDIGIYPKLKFMLHGGSVNHHRIAGIGAENQCDAALIGACRFWLEFPNNRFEPRDLHPCSSAAWRNVFRIADKIGRTNLLKQRADQEFVLPCPKSDRLRRHSKLDRKRCRAPSSQRSYRPESGRPSSHVRYC